MSVIRLMLPLLFLTVLTAADETVPGSPQLKSAGFCLLDAAGMPLVESVVVVGLPSEVVAMRKWDVDLVLDVNVPDKATKQVSDLIANNPGRVIGFIVNGKVVSSSQMKEKYAGGKIVCSTHFTKEKYDYMVESGAKDSTKPEK